MSGFKIFGCSPRGNGNHHSYFINPTGVRNTLRKATHMSEDNTHDVLGRSQIPELRRNIELKAAVNPANLEIVQEVPHKRKKNYVPKTPQECAHS